LDFAAGQSASRIATGRSHHSGRRPHRKNREDRIISAIRRQLGHSNEPWSPTTPRRTILSGRISALNQNASIYGIQVNNSTERVFESGSGVDQFAEDVSRDKRTGPLAIVGCGRFRCDNFLRAICLLSSAQRPDRKLLSACHGIQSSLTSRRFCRAPE